MERPQNRQLAICGRDAVPRYMTTEIESVTCRQCLSGWESFLENPASARRWVPRCG
jgi:hypothetical protein